MTLVCVRDVLEKQGCVFHREATVEWNVRCRKHKCAELYHLSRRPSRAPRRSEQFCRHLSCQMAWQERLRRKTRELDVFLITDGAIAWAGDDIARFALARFAASTQHLARTDK